MNPVDRRVRTLCGVCREEIPGNVFVADGEVMMRKRCPKHGTTVVRIDPDAEGYARLFARQGGEPAEYLDVCGSTIINVTDRCNMRCPNCYHPEAGRPDPSVEEVVRLALSSRAPSVILMGAEPTMRDDLPLLVAAVKRATERPVLIYTNGLRLADREYARSLAGCGLDAVCISMHTRGYVGEEALRRKRGAVWNMRVLGIPIHHISFTLSDLAEMPEVAASMREFWGVPHHWRIRCPAGIGRHQRPVYASEFVQGVVNGFERFGWERMDIRYGDNSPYHLNLNVMGAHVRVIRWPSVHDVVLDDLGEWPTALFLPERGEMNFVKAALLQEGMKLGRAVIRSADGRRQWQARADFKFSLGAGTGTGIGSRQTHAD